MKNIKIYLFVILVFTLSLQSCFEIKEVVKLNKDGSGTFSMIIDLSQVKAMLEGFGAGEDEDGESPFEGMEEEYESTRMALEKIAGISNINFSSEMEGYIITSSFDFGNIDALNAGLDVIYERPYEDEDIPAYYRFSKKYFERTDAYNFMDQVKEELGTDDLDIEGMDLSSLFSEVAYVNEITFEGLKIKKVKSGDPKVSDDGSTVINRYLIFNDTINQSLGFKLKLK